MTLVRDPEAIAPLVTRVLDAGRARRRFAIVDISIGGVPYQVVAHLMFASVDRPRVTAFVALMVNLQWVRQDYLGELLRQVATIDGESDAMAIAVLDEQRTVVATSGVTSSEPQVRERAFPLLFFEPALVSALPEPRPVVRMWTAQVRPAPGANAAASTLGARMLLLSSLAGAASLVAVLLTVRAVRVSAELATMKSDFVSAVTHELKTPVALIALVGETLERGRYTSEDTIRDYAAILSQEARRLNHLIENLLTYSRLSDMASVYSFEPVELNELVEDALTPFRPRMTDLGFELDVRIEADLAPVLADRAAMVRVFANVIDNALKYLDRWAQSDHRRRERGAPRADLLHRPRSRHPR